MQKKFLTTYILLGALIILLGGAYLIKYKPFDKEKNSQLNTAFYQNFNKDYVTKVEIIKAGKILTLLKESDKWQEIKDNAEKKEADSTLVDAMFTKLADLKIGEPITQTEDKKSLFQVDGSNLQVKMYNNDKEAVNFYIGKNTADFSGNYIRREGENKIYSTSERITSYFDKTTFAKTEE